jgi:hypothetical protein
MAVKVYLKKGNLNYKERMYINALQKELEKRGINGKQFNPATNFGELESLYNEYCIEEVSFQEIKTPKENTKNTGDSGDTYENHKEFMKGMQDNVEKEETSSFGGGDSGDDSPFIDPFNQAEPIVRDYVKDEGFKDQSQQQTVKTSFDEPVSFGESFELPKDSGSNSGGGGSRNNKSSLGGRDREKDKDKKSEPLNPALENVSDAKKRKSTKKMAKAIVYGVCKLAEFGCKWWVTKDITEDKLVEYEINDTMDMQILLSLDENQQITVRNWFAMQVKLADEELKISEEDKQDLADSLYEVMLEKGIAPSPTQELIINAISTIVIGLGVKAYAMQQQVQNVLNQLILMRKEQKEQTQKQQQINDELDRAEAEEQRRYEENLKRAEQKEQSQSAVNEVSEDIEGLDVEEITSLTRIE